MTFEMAALVWVAGVAHLVSAFRLACYQRDEQRYHWCDRILISLLGAVFCLAGIDVLLKFLPVSPWHAVVSVFSCVMIVRSSGNIIVLWHAFKH
ncbi:MULTISPECIES: phage holin family protein [unclassified Pseudomonas]|uniref:phage holin family protein n=1 Tax=unclassified Pseudomonas TaxID=196821 RepID=UPI000C88C75C|nr:MULTISPECIES: phage holin family protein [unclassified Pseudomonas]PMZ84389.1 hypothetical protein C1X61_29785 [Pseudomonas sp. FW215-T2]PNA08970.1 hypothetical protein C1X62_23430 [Pseudomonas sp. FW215-R3]PNB35631.1 hypothetical protein C1X63_21935 [Pseudomonas sp. FW305-131]